MNIVVAFVNCKDKDRNNNQTMIIIIDLPDRITNPSSTPNHSLNTNPSIFFQPALIVLKPKVENTPKTERKKKIPNIKIKQKTKNKAITFLSDLNPKKKNTEFTHEEHQHQND
eukprot:GHVL01018296.1.p1 GENE.GHVL01018296.1~~GHVL01018296.1.p1  ORF type:complete len:113 (-),score=6.48 GHVL01018296.1:1024-1362(-)